MSNFYGLVYLVLVRTVLVHYNEVDSCFSFLLLFSTVKSILPINATSTLTCGKWMKPLDCRLINRAGRIGPILMDPLQGSHMGGIVFFFFFFPIALGSAWSRPM